MMASMSQSRPLNPPSPPTLGSQGLQWSLMAVVRVSLVFSPRPAALLVRRVFKVTGAQTAESLGRHAPDNVTVLRDVRYGEEEEMVLDLVYPVSINRPLPLVLWAHG